MIFIEIVLDRICYKTCYLVCNLSFSGSLKFFEEFCRDLTFRCLLFECSDNPQICKICLFNLLWRAEYRVQPLSQSEFVLYDDNRQCSFLSEKLILIVVYTFFRITCVYQGGSKIKNYVFRNRHHVKKERIKRLNIYNEFRPDVWPAWFPAIENNVQKISSLQIF